MKLDFSYIKHHTCRGKRYEVFWRRPPRGPGKHPGPGAGQCDDPRTKGKRIYIHPDKDEFELLGTIAHEFIHAVIPDAPEECAEEFESTLLRMLRRMGATISFQPK